MPVSHLFDCCFISIFWNWEAQGPQVCFLSRLFWLSGVPWDSMWNLGFFFFLFKPQMPFVILIRISTKDTYLWLLRSMVRYLRSVDVPEGRLILITPPPLCEAAWAQECLQQGECGLPDAGLRPQGSTPCLRFPSTEVTEELPSCLLLTESV